ncbi:hypothetical protein L7F22_057979 [Adiantum nelumboides]|nr:hypothetical protein [Adiantum nelumboides]
MFIVHEEELVIDVPIVNAFDANDLCLADFLACQKKKCHALRGLNVLQDAKNSISLDADARNFVALHADAENSIACALDAGNFVALQEGTFGFSCQDSIANMPEYGVHIAPPLLGKEGPSSCDEFTSKFAKGYAFEKCAAARKDPAGHRIAWAQFGEGVVQMISFRAGSLERKVETWRKQSSGTILKSIKKVRMTKSGSNICTESDQGTRGAMADYLPDLEALFQRLQNQLFHPRSSKLIDLKSSFQENKDQLLVYQGKDGMARSLMEDIDTLEVRIDLLR